MRDVPDGHRFSAVGLQLPLSSDFRFGVICEGLIALAPGVISLSEFWTRSLGEIDADEISRSSVFLVAHSAGPNGTLQVGDEVLRSAVGKWLTALLIALDDQTLRSTRPFDGIVNDGQVEITTFSNALDLVRPPYAIYRKFGHPLDPSPYAYSRAEDLLAAAELSAHLSFEMSARVQEWRIRRAISIYAQSRRELFIFDKLAQNVRAIEALINIPAGAGRRLFGDKLLDLFEGADRNFLEEIYSSRSLVAHVNEDAVLIPFDRDKMKNFVLQLIASDFMARSLLRRIIPDQRLRQVFGNRVSSKDYWGQDEASRRAQWGARLNLDSALSLYDLDLMSNEALGEI